MANPTFYGAALMLAGLIAIAAPREERHPLGAAWCILAMMWIVNVLMYDPATSVLFALYEAGLHATDTDVMAFMDALAAIVILALSAVNPYPMSRWGWPLFGLLSAQLVLHSADAMSGMQGVVYLTALDVFFLAQMAVFGFVGGPGVVNYVAAYLSGRGGFRNDRLAHQRAQGKP